MLWVSNNKNDTKIITIKDEIIYLSNPPIAALDEYVFHFKMNNIPTKNTIGIPFNYISRINVYEGKNIIELLFRDCTEEVFVTDADKKEEIFNYCKEHIPGLKHTVVAYSKLKAGKKPLIAMLVVIGLFTWSYYLASEFEKGIMYEVEGQHYNSIAGVVLLLAGLGTKKLIVLFGGLFVIALIALLRKIKNPPVVRVLYK